MPRIKVKSRRQVGKLTKLIAKFSIKIWQTLIWTLVGSLLTGWRNFQARGRGISNGNKAIACNVNRWVASCSFHPLRDRAWFPAGTPGKQTRRAPFWNFYSWRLHFACRAAAEINRSPRGPSGSGRVFIDYHRLCMGTLWPRRKRSWAFCSPPSVTISKNPVSRCSSEDVYLFLNGNRRPASVIALLAGATLLFVPREPLCDPSVRGKNQGISTRFLFFRVCVCTCVCTFLVLS